MPRDQRCRDF